MVWTGFVPDDLEHNWQTLMPALVDTNLMVSLTGPCHWVYYIMSFCFFICKNHHLAHRELQRVSGGKYIKCLLTVVGMLQPLPFPHIQCPSISNNGSKAYLCLAFVDKKYLQWKCARA